ncbi:hypothetical protein VSDG_00033 [Cytospora chrysosperma]|uniref:Ecp2 effector protein domain-containing protein n=1 Tax=Cytospora chrysosperma TaxID=252740 RepID=A0A423WQF0_CYTCH|nr:hypothetical protein VSDG_00033 [Valsa sordida]
MQFSLNTTLATVPFLTTTALAGTGINGSADFRGCFDKGEKWTDLGTSEQIHAALDSNACNVDTGAWKVGEVLDICICVEKTSHYSADNSFHFSWTITSVPDGQDTATLSHDVCVGFAEEIINKCPHGGVFDMQSGPSADGGDVVGAAVTADPQQGPDCGTEF